MRPADPIYIEHAKGELRLAGIDQPTKREAQIFVHCTEWWIKVARMERERGKKAGMILGGVITMLGFAGALLGWILVR